MITKTFQNSPECFGKICTIILRENGQCIAYARYRSLFLSLPTLVSQTPHHSAGLVDVVHRVCDRPRVATPRDKLEMG